MAEDTWIIDPDALTLDEYLILDQGPHMEPEKIKRVLGKFVVNKTEEELGRDYTWGELRKHLATARKALEEDAVPKEIDTP